MYMFYDVVDKINIWPSWDRQSFGSLYRCPGLYVINVQSGLLK